MDTVPICENCTICLNGFVTVFTYRENVQRLCGVNSLDIPCTCMGGIFACDLSLCGMQLKNCVRWAILQIRLIGCNHVFSATTLKSLLITNGLYTERNTKSVHGVCCLSKRKVVPLHAMKAYEE